MASYVDRLLDSLKLLLSPRDLEVHVNDQIESFLRSGKFLRNFLCYASKLSTKHSKLSNLSNHFKDLVKKADSLSIGMDKHKDISELCKLLEEIELIKPEAREFFVVPKLETHNDLKTHEVLAVFLDFLQENSEELLNYRANFIVPMIEQTQILGEELRFLITFLGDMPLLQCIEVEKLEGLLIVIEAVANGAGNLYYLSFVNKIDQVMAREMNVALACLFQEIGFVKAKIKDCVEIPKPQRLVVYTTNEFVVSSAYSLQENLKQLLNHKAYMIVPVKNKIETLQKEHMLLTSFLEGRAEQEEMKDVVTRVGDVTNEAEYIVDSFMAKGGPVWYFTGRLSQVLEEIKLIKETELSNKMDNTGTTQKFARITGEISSQIINEVMVGFEDERTAIKDRLAGGPTQLEVISIVGMAGLGKTTLAQNLYNDPLAIYHFPVRAWCCVSQVYQRKGLLLDILGSIVKLTEEHTQSMTDEDLAHVLYKYLKGRRFLIIIDDIWKIQAWYDLVKSFPDDRNGSRIMVTTRLKDLALQIKRNSNPLELRFLTEHEGWNLLQQKIFHKESCPPELVDVGMKIAALCHRLPLVVVVVAGLLAKMEMTPNSWNQFAGSLRSQVAGEPKLWMDMLVKSYNHLPNYLKPCFLYCGAFIQDKEILTQKLTRLWIAEGLIQKTQQKSLEDLADEYLVELIGRSLLLVSKRRSDGGVKACRIHDLFRDLCLKKANEENFLRVIDGPFSIHERHRCLCLNSEPTHLSSSRPFGPNIRSLLVDYTTWFNSVYDVSSICKCLRLLRILDLWNCELLGDIPSEIGLLIHLRYLALRGRFKSIPSSIGSLWNLEVLLLNGFMAVELPDAILNMKKLKHVQANRISFTTSWYQCAIQDKNIQLESLESISKLNINSEREESILRCFPNIRRLTCEFHGMHLGISNMRYPLLYSLNHLKTLKVRYSSVGNTYPQGLTFPSTLKKLTLSKFHLTWKELSTIGTLPDLEVLKIRTGDFEGPEWDARVEEFQKLKFLKLDNLNVAKWNACNHHFPRLQQLVLRDCKELEKIPSGFTDILTLQMIEIKRCSQSVVESAMKIQLDQKDVGNESLKVLIYAPDQD